jgi:HK97 family phage prohead protease
MLRDLRKLPVQVLERMRDADALADVGVRASGGRLLVEGGTASRSMHERQRIETRAEGDNAQPVLDGYAAVYDVAYPIGGGKASAWGWDETVVSGAVTKSLAERDNVYWLHDHEGLSVASTKEGNLEIVSDSVGILTIAKPDMRSQWNQEVVLRAQSGALDAMSWAFVTVRQEWNDDYTERFITEAKMFDVSGVKWPANPATHMHARHQDVGTDTGVSIDLAQREIDALKLLRRRAA